MTTTPRKTPNKARASTTPSRLPPRTTPMKTPGRTPRKALPNDQGEEGIQVAIRMRPLNQNEHSHNRVWKVLPKYQSITQTTRQGQPLPERVTGRTFFTFDKTFGEDTTTKQVYENVAKGIVSSVVTGLNGTIFAYGQTSSGKTYTMQGSGTIQQGSSGDGGIVHMAASDIFEHIRTAPDRIFLVRASFLEIYNEEVRDLLNSSSDNRTLQIREDPRRGVFVQAKEEIVTDFDSLLSVLFQGEKSRAFAATAMNERSSRSHTIFRITIESRTKNNDKENDEENQDEDGAVLISTLNLVDLAGSESVRHTGATGDRQKEGGMINQSLLTLSRVIVALGTPNQTHVNFRDSKLTRILQPALSGNARMAVICCATPSELYLEETRSTLQFASRATLVKTRAQVNEVLDDRSLIRRLQRELAEARKNSGGSGRSGSERVKALEEKAANAGTAAKEAEEKLKRLQASILNSGVLFTNGEQENKSHRRNQLTEFRKRRMSDGLFLTLGGKHTPQKAIVAVDCSNTVPRPFKKNKIEAAPPISAASELTLLRDALEAKGSVISSLKGKIDDMTRLSQSKESELQASQSSNNDLRSERDEAQARSSDLSLQLENCKKELEKVVAAHQVALSEKEHTIQKTIAQLESELNDRRVLEEAVDTLQEEKSQLQKRIASELAGKESEITQLQESNAQFNMNLQLKTKEYGDLMEEHNNLLSDHSKLKEECTSAIHEANGQADEARQSLAQSQEEVAVLNTKIVELTERFNEASIKLVDSNDRLSIAITKNSCLEEALAEMTAERDNAVYSWEKAKNYLEESQQKINKLSVAIDGLETEKRVLENNVKETGQQLESVKTRMEQTDEMLANTCDEKENLSKYTKELEGEKEALESNLAALLKEKQAIEVQLMSIKESFDESQKLSFDRNSRIEQLEECVIEFERAIKTLSEEKKELIEGIESRTEELNGTRLSLQQTLSEKESIEQELQETRAVVGELQKDLSAFRESCSVSEVRCKELESRLESTETSRNEVALNLKLTLEERDSLVLSTQCLEKELEEMKKTFENMQSYNGQIEEEVSRLIEQRDFIQIDLNSKAMELEKATHELMISQNRINSLVSSLDFLEHEYHLASMESSAVVQDRRKANEYSDQLEKTIAEQSKFVRELELKLEQASLEISAGADAKSSMNQKTAALHEELRHLKEQNKILVDSIECLQISEGDLSSQTRILTEERDSALSRLRYAEDAVIECRREVNSLNEINENFQKEKVELIDTREQMQADLVCLQRTIEENASTIDALETELRKTIDERNHIVNKLENMDKELKAKTDEMIEIHDMLESTSAKLSLSKQRENDLEDELDSKVTMLTQSIKTFEKERDDLMKEVEEHRLKLNNSTMSQTVVTELEEKISELKGETLELTELLSSANKSVEDSRQAALSAEKELQIKTKNLEIALKRLSEVEEELRAINAGSTITPPMKKVLILISSQSFKREVTTRQQNMITILESRGIIFETVDGSNPEMKEKRDRLFSLSGLRVYPQFFVVSNSSCDYWGNWDRFMQSNDNGSLEADLFGSTGEDLNSSAVQRLEEEKRSLESRLIEEREYQKSELAKLQQLMGDEQRSLIREAEDTMESYRNQIVELEKSIKKAEADAYTARENAEDLRDQSKQHLNRLLQAENKISALEKENKRLTQLVENHDIESENRLASLSSEIRKIRSELEAKKASLRIAEDNLAASRRQKYETEKELKITKDAVVQAEAVKCELEERIASLSSQKWKSSLDEEEIEKLRAENKSLKDDIQAKSERISKLQAVKLTREKVEAIKKLKTDYADTQKKLNEAEKQIEDLRESIASGISDSTTATEFSKLQFDKNALENKLRKFASHCQRLEDEKAEIVSVLQSSSRKGIDVDDIPKAIVNLCDRLASLEEECEALSHSEHVNLDIENLRKCNETLQSELHENKKKLEALTRTEHNLKETIASLHRDQDELRQTAERARGSVESLESEKSRQIRYLEQENLQLMIDLKAKKKELQTVKSELNMLRTKALQDDTIDFSLSARPNPDKSSKNTVPTPASVRAKRSLETATPREKENSQNTPATGQSKSRRLLGSTRKTPIKIPGLGDAFEPSDENTQECKQS